MKQLYKTFVVAVCIVLFTACNSNATNLSDSSQQASSNTSSSQQVSNNSSSQPASSMDSSQEDIALSQLVKAKEDNLDTVAWLAIPNTTINNPVMQTANNEDYLRKDETGKYDIWGCYFADYYSNLTSREALTQNTVIYGHSESTENPSGKRFTQLFKYLEQDFLEENPNIYLTIAEETLTFEIFAVFFTDIGFYYIDPIPSDQGFDSFIKTINEKNEYIFESINVTETDKLLTLSACATRYDTEKTGNHRIVVMARLADTPSENVVIGKNQNPQRPK